MSNYFEWIQPNGRNSIWDFSVPRRMRCIRGSSDGHYNAGFETETTWTIKRIQEYPNSWRPVTEFQAMVEEILGGVECQT